MLEEKSFEIKFPMSFQFSQFYVYSLQKIHIFPGNDSLN